MPDVCASFQKAVIDVLVQKSLNALKAYQCNSLILAGGVVRNTTLRKSFENVCVENNISFYVPSPELCTDNAAMIARAGQLRLSMGQRSNFDLDIVPNLALTNTVDNINS